MRDAFAVSLCRVERIQARHQKFENGVAGAAQAAFFFVSFFAPCSSVELTRSPVRPLERLSDAVPHQLPSALMACVAVVVGPPGFCRLKFPRRPTGVRENRVGHGAEEG